MRSKPAFEADVVYGLLRQDEFENELVGRKATVDLKLSGYKTQETFLRQHRSFCFISFNAIMGSCKYPYFPSHFKLL